MKTGHDLMGLIKFLAQDNWREHLEEVRGEHLGPALDAFGLEFEDIDTVLDGQWAMTLWGCAFEDFLTRSVAPDESNLVDVYLKRRGWNEGVQAKVYMKALRNSIMSLYEVSEIVPGKCLLARDLLRGGEPLLVSEGSATKTLKSWDKIAARIVPMKGKNILAGGILPFSLDAETMLRDNILDGQGKRAVRQKPPVDDDILRRAAPLFSNAWLFDVLPKAMGRAQPVLQNSDGENVILHTIRFQIASGASQKTVAGHLDTMVALQRENPSFWNWLGAAKPEKRAASTATDAVAWNVTMEDGRTVLGNVEIKGRFLILSVNSASRATRGIAMLQQSLGDLVRAPLTEIQTVEQVRASKQGQKSPEPDIPPEIATRIVHELLDRQYHEVLDEPVGMIGDISPRSAVRTARGREKVAEWLKYLENQTASHRDPADPMATYDFGWMWRELKIENLRR
jgi:hypothetical protein